MISTTGIPPKSSGRLPAFTLLELIIVMVVLSVLLALAIPTLSSSMRGHQLEQAGAQLLALTEYARDEAVSQGVPMVVSVNAANGTYRADTKAGYPGDASRAKAYQLGSDLHFDAAAATGSGGGDTVAAAEFAPDGTLAATSVPTLRIIDRWNAAVTVAQTTDGYGYELQKETH